MRERERCNERSKRRFKVDTGILYGQILNWLIK